jgi:hypothetical protein
MAWPAEGDPAILLLGLGDLAVLGNVEVDLGADPLAPQVASSVVLSPTGCV